MAEPAENLPDRVLVEAEELLAARDLGSALKSFHRAEGRGADPSRCAAGRWFVHMLRGDFSAAWAESHSLRAARINDPNCLWRGDDVRGKRVIVRCLHGFGDAIQFCRYAPQLKAVTKNVVWQIPPRLLRLARCLRGVEQVVTWEQENVRSSTWEIQLEVMELPCIFQTSLDELPIAINYLHLPGEVVQSVAAQMGEKAAPRIGVVWAAGEWNPSRSIPLELLRPVLETNGCEFWNLQGGAARSSADKLPRCAALHDAAPCNRGILELAAVIAQLDLVITVDSLAAHLAGALGVPAWVMLQYEADWRWMVGRSDSPWYPSLRLFRQPFPGEWVRVVSAVEQSLHDWLGSEEKRLAA